MKKRKIHPLADTYPMLPEAEYRALRDSVANDGLQDPIARSSRTGEILDGRNRLRALDELGKRPRYVDVDGDPVVYILAQNERRRHMSPTQRLAVAALAGIDKPPCGSMRQWDRACKLARDHADDLRRVAKDGTLDLTYNRLYPEERAPRAKPQQPAALVETMRLKDSVKRLTKERSDLTAELKSLQESHAAIAELASTPLEPIKQYELKSGLREATAVVLVSDLHPEEKVDPATIPTRQNGRPWNAFNLAVADLRLRRLFAGAEWLIRKDQQDFQINNLLMPLLGDLITGHLHPENLENNAFGPARAAHWVGSRIIAGVDRLLAADIDLERIDMPCTGGNHGRSTHKVRPSTWADHSWEWMLYQRLAEYYANEPRVNVHASRSIHVHHTIYGFTWHGHHGDSIGFQGGVGGIAVPLNRQIKRWDVAHRSDFHDIGHFHQYMSGRNWTSNGSMIGFSAYSSKFEPEEPCQAYYLIDAKRSKTSCCPIWVSDPSEERALWDEDWRTE